MSYAFNKLSIYSGLSSCDSGSDSMAFRLANAQNKIENAHEKILTHLHLRKHYNAHRIVSDVRIQ